MPAQAFISIWLRIVAIAVAGQRVAAGASAQREKQAPAYHSAATRAGLGAVIARSPSLANSAASASAPALPVVSNLSPVKIELAPARKQSACVALAHALAAGREPDHARGIVIRATATVRTNSISSIFASGVSASMSPSTVPLTGTSALIGTLSGWARQRRERVEEADPVRAASRPCRRCRRSRRYARARTCSSVSSRSCKVRVVMTSP